MALLKSEPALKQCSLGSWPNGQTTDGDAPWTADILGAVAAKFQLPPLPTWKSSKEKQSSSHVIQVCHPLHLSPCVNILMQKETDSSLSGKVRFPLPSIYPREVWVGSHIGHEPVTWQNTSYTASNTFMLQSPAKEWWKRQRMRNAKNRKTI